MVTVELLFLVFQIKCCLLRMIGKGKESRHDNDE